MFYGRISKPQADLFQEPNIRELQERSEKRLVLTRSKNSWSVCSELLLLFEPVGARDAMQHGDARHPRLGVN